MSAALAKSVGVDALIFEHRCKICQLSKEAPDLFKELHELILVQSWLRSRAMNVINTKIREEGRPLKILNSVNMTMHFNKHVQLDERVATAVNKAESQTPEVSVVPRRPRLADIAPEAAGAVEQMLDQKVGSELQDYSNLNDLIEIAREKLSLLDQHIEVETSIGPDGQPQIGSDGKPIVRKGLSLEALQVYTKLISELRNCIVDLNKVRRSGSLMLLAMRSLAEKFSRSSSIQMIAEFEAVATLCRKHNIPESEIMHAVEGLKMRTVDILIDNARIAIDEVMAQYKIKEDKL